MLRRIALATTAVLVALTAQAGGPAYIAIFSGRPTPATWPGGIVRYCTDVGDLSPVLSQADADALVARAFARWTSVPTAAVVAEHAGHLVEDINGSNVSRAGGRLSIPAEVREREGVAILYDADGNVTEALLGTGASSKCATNAVFGGLDTFTSDGHIAHALVVINGACVQAAADVPALRQNLVRVIGRVLGLEWSQLNENVVTGTPAPSLEDYAGWPLMHSIDAACGGNALACVPEPEQPRMDDRAALSRLYPVTSANLAQFPGKTIFADTTTRVSGSVRLRNGRTVSGVNVVARLVDPVTGVPSRRYAASSVSGFLLRSKRRPRDSAAQGWYDLAGLEIPAGDGSARYQISVERNAAIIAGAQKTILTLTRGAQNTLDITMFDAVAEKLVLVFGANPGVPVGTPAPNPIKVRAVYVDDKGADVPVAGVSIKFSASPAGSLLFSPCNAETCTIVSDSAGEAATTVTVKQEGVITVTASLPNGFSVATTVLGIAQPFTITPIVPKYWVAAHASVAVPLTARVLENSVAAGGKTVNYKIMSGTATLASAAALTNAQGDATAPLNLTNVSGDVQVSACVAPNNAPCATFVVFAVTPENVRIEKIGGDQQVVTVGQNLQAITVRVTDVSSPPNPVLAARVQFTIEAFHLQPEGERTVVGEVVVTHPSQPVPALPVSQTVVLTDAAGTATIAPAFAKELGALNVTVRAEAGATQTTFAITVAWPGLSSARSGIAIRPARVSPAMIRPGVRLRRR